MTANVNGGSREHVSGSYTTPEWLATLIGFVALDPCTNDRTVIVSLVSCILERDDDGLCEGAPGRYRSRGSYARAGASTSTFINPPYGHGQVLPWVEHYGHTDFRFLLRWDPSTEWFRALIAITRYVWFPDRRINFDPPPGIKAANNPFPHALYLRNPPNEALKANGTTLTVNHR